MAWALFQHLSQTFFQNAHDFDVNGGQFFSIANENGIVNINNAPSNDDPVSITLWKHVADGAIFDSAERYPPGKCHPGTRERVIQRIMAWIDDSDPTQRILWIYGPAGCGKSALAQSICELLSQMDVKRCRGSFFFARGATDRGKGLKLFATLSYQLAVQIPAMRAEINAALSRDPSLPTKSMDLQLFSLIIQPLLRCQPFPSQRPVLIIDGLDECEEDQGMDTQRNIIMLISQSIIKHNIPLRFIIASRPESWIRDTFETSPLPSITLPLSLRDDEDADDDIRAYLTDEFERIRMENQRIMSSVARPWPPANIVERFVYEASGQYIYASTVLKFVGKSSRFTNPLAQLLILLSPGPHRALAFSELDRLYERIVSTYPRPATMKRVLEGILLEVNTTGIQIMLNVDPAEVVLVLDALSPLIDITRPGPLSEHEQLLEPIFGSLLAGREMIRLCHLSFREFLEDETRSGAFHINVHDSQKDLYRAFFGLIYRNLDQKYATEAHVPLNIGHATYKYMMSLVVQTTMTFSGIDDLCLLVNDMTKRLRHLDPPTHAIHVECFLQDMSWIKQMASRFRGLLTGSSTGPMQQKRLSELMDALSELQNVSADFRNRVLQHLSSSNRFIITPTLVFLVDFHWHGYSIWPTVNQMFAISGQSVSDVLATLRKYRHFLDLDYTHRGHGWTLCALNLIKVFQADDSKASRNSQYKWGPPRNLLVYQYLTTALNDGNDRRKSYRYLGRFFESCNLSDIDSDQYFQHPSNLSFLALMSDLSAWNEISRDNSFEYFVTSVLCWFNRQMTNPKTRKLLDEHDKHLARRLRKNMNQIFQHHYLPRYKASYLSELVFSTTTDDGPNSTRIGIKVVPIPEGGYREAIIPYVPPDWQNLNFVHWHTFHNEVFGKPSSTDDRPSAIDRRDWHPYLASCLLKSLARDLYRAFNPKFDGHSGELMDSYFNYIVPCMPYAETTTQNLDSLRAIAYLRGGKLKLKPPSEFWSLSVEFLKKYDRSVLSDKELALLKTLLHK